MQPPPSILLWPCLLVLQACYSVQWLELPEDVPATWRNYTLRNGQLAFVLATDGSLATEAYREIEAILQAARPEVGDPGKGLVIAVGRYDALLVDPVHLYGARSRAAPKKERDISSVDRDLLLRLMPIQLRRGDDRLALPRELGERVAWIIVLPTDSCLSKSSADLLDSALRQARLAWWQRLLAAPFMPVARGAAFDMAKAAAADVVFQILFADAVADRSAFEKARLACMQSLGYRDRAERAMAGLEVQARQAVSRPHRPRQP